MSALRGAAEHTGDWLDLTPGDLFPWWQWFPNLGKQAGFVVGSGITGARLDQSILGTSIEFRVQHLDGTACLLRLICIQRDRFKVRVEEA